MLRMIFRLLMLAVVIAIGYTVGNNFEEIKKATQQYFVKLPRGFYVKDIGTIVCRDYHKDSCGMTLKNCASNFGEIEQLTCVTNVIEFEVIVKQ